MIAVSGESLACEGLVLPLNADGTDLAADLGLESLVMLLLETDARVEGAEDARGWWADSDYGSRAWQMERAKRTPEMLEQYRSASAAALQPLCEIAGARNVSVEVSVTVAGVRRVITVERDSGAVRFESIWRDTI
jgi:phage gp46-like protein